MVNGLSKNWISLQGESHKCDITHTYTLTTKYVYIVYICTHLHKSRTCLMDRTYTSQARQQKFSSVGGPPTHRWWNHHLQMSHWIWKNKELGFKIRCLIFILAYRCYIEVHKLWSPSLIFHSPPTIFAQLSPKLLRSIFRLSSTKLMVDEVWQISEFYLKKWIFENILNSAHVNNCSQCKQHF